MAILFPHIIYGTCTKADDAAYTHLVWLTNETTNKMISIQTNSSGQYLYDLANMGSYSNEDIITVAIEAYGNRGYVLTKTPFDDTSVDTIETGDQRLNAATITMNFKISFGVSKNKARSEIFKKIFNQLDTDPPTYTGRNSVAQTYEILSAYPEITPTFPCIVVNPIEKKTMKLGVAERSNVSLPSSVDIDFYAKTRDNKKAIDVARDKVEMILENNWITESLTVNTSVGGQKQDIQGVE